MNIENFAQIMKLREQFAINREKSKFSFADHTFDRREKVMDRTFNFKKQMLVVEDKFHNKRHERKIKEIKIKR